MNSFVRLFWKRNRGWPWPEDSWGLGPMFGDDGWCSDCGMPTRDQTGSMVLRRTGLKAEGAWVPNWRFDTVCLDEALAAVVAESFDLVLRPVTWHGAALAEVRQVVIPTVGSAWFATGDLERRTLDRHGATGSTCAACGRWRWLPLPMSELPAPVLGPGEISSDVAASPEWFGDGCQSSRDVIFRRELAELLADASPKDFKILEL